MFGREVFQAQNIFTPTLSDSSDEPKPFIFRALASGNVKVTTLGGSTGTIKDLAAGDVVDWVVCKRIWATGTALTAAQIECYSE